MSAPICDFVKKYVSAEPMRLHMPGHKGIGSLGFEKFDITEIDGADELFAPDGIIAESEAQASEIFNSHTYYSASGSTLGIQAMLYLTKQFAAARGENTLILACRNAHKAFINATALLDIDVEWIFQSEGTYHGCSVSAEEIEERVLQKKPTAVYLTSPDYLGNIADIEAISRVCQKHGALLLVDGAHGAYLKFLPSSRHPIDLGADMCCASAHKTLPVVTGGAYLHISHGAPDMLAENAKSAMALFASSSPSYLILQSLDAANDYLCGFKETLSEFIPKAEWLKNRLAEHGFELCGDEPLKITLKPKSFGYTGGEIAKILENDGIYPEFYDDDFIVLMLSPQNGNELSDALQCSLCSVEKREPIRTFPPKLPKPQAVLSPHDALFCASECLPVDLCEGKICALSYIGCPPAIPIAVCGEMISKSVIENMKYYGVESCNVCIKKD